MPERGRIPADVREAFAAAQSGDDVEDEPQEATWIRESPRSDLLTLADSYVNGDRNAQYGDPNADFDRTSKFWSTYLSGVFHRKLAERNHVASAPVLSIIDDLVDSHDVAWMMTLLKASRSTVSPFKGDHYADAAGYMACGYDCTVYQTGHNWASDELDG